MSEQTNKLDKKHKSGAQKRKEKKKALENLKSFGNIGNYFGKSDFTVEQPAEELSATAQTTENVPSTDESCETSQKSQSTKKASNEESDFESQPPYKQQRVESHTSDCSEFEHAECDENREDRPVPLDAFFTKSDMVSEKMFWSFHPHQPKENIPFNSELTYYRNDKSGHSVQRKWVTYNEEKQALFCSFCVMYAAEKFRGNLLIQGCSDWRHVSVRTAEHEKSQCHQMASEAYFVCSTGKSVKHMSENEQVSSRRKIVFERRAVLKCVIDIIFYIGFQALPYRSKQPEAIVKIFADDDNEILHNRGNFLEAVKMLADYDPFLQAYLKCVIEKAKKRDPTKKGRGNFVTFLSKTTVAKIFNIIGEMIKEMVVKDVCDAGMFSIQLDSAQDVSFHDYSAIVVRYVKGDKAKEKLLRLVNVTDSKAQGLHKLLTESLSEVGLQLKACIGDSFDGAANMSGTYNGLQALFKQARPGHIHTWCYAHVLNLVIGDISSVCI